MSKSEIPTIRDLQAVMLDKYRTELIDKLKTKGEAESFLTGLLDESIRELADEFKDAGYTFTKGTFVGLKDCYFYYVLVGEPTKSWHGVPL